LATAMILKIEVSDGIIAPAYNAEALEVLKNKKQGKFIVLKADPDFVPPDMEYRICGGLGYMQKTQRCYIWREALAEYGHDEQGALEGGQAGHDARVNSHKVHPV